MNSPNCGSNAEEYDFHGSPTSSIPIFIFVVLDSVSINYSPHYKSLEIGLSLKYGREFCGILTQE
jgi:hypothetical protein